MPDNERPPPFAARVGYAPPGRCLLLARLRPGSGRLFRRRYDNGFTTKRVFALAVVPFAWPMPSVQLASVVSLPAPAFPHTATPVRDDGIPHDGRRALHVRPDRFPFDMSDRHPIDNRVSKIDDTYHVATPGKNDRCDGPHAGLSRRRAFKSREAIDFFSQPRSCGASLFPERNGGRCWSAGRAGAGRNLHCRAELSASLDPVHWRLFESLLSPGCNNWNTGRLGSPAPNKTGRGWLVVIRRPRALVEASNTTRAPSCADCTSRGGSPARRAAACPCGRPTASALARVTARCSPVALCRSTKRSSGGSMTTRWTPGWASPSAP